MTLICPIHGIVPAPGGSARERGEWRRQGSTWVHSCGKEEVSVMPSRDDRFREGLDVRRPDQ